MANLETAETFVWSSARLLDRHRFSFLFRGASREPVVTALRAYLNADGGFGNALEPDKRCPDSQPVDQQVGLEILREIGFEEDIVRGVCDFLTSITTDEGGVPTCLPSVNAYPRAPWWNCEQDPPASLNPTAALAGLLHEHGIDHPWRERATEFCWREIEASQTDEVHALLCIMAFLEAAPDHDRARACFDALGPRIVEQTCLDPADEGYVKKPLDWASTPESWCRELFETDTIDAHLDALTARQQDDGGWPISWPTVSPAVEFEWRGAVTINALTVLRAYGRLDV